MLITVSYTHLDVYKRQKLSNLFYTFLNIAASTQKLGINLIRVAILIIFVWIGGLKFYNYEAEGIVPFVANSPFMSFFYTKSAPEYKEYKLKEGEFNEAKHQWHVENNTYGFSHGLGILIMAIGILTFLGIFSPKIGLVGAGLAIIMTIGTLSFLVTTPEVWVPDVYKRQIHTHCKFRTIIMQNHTIFRTNRTIATNILKLYIARFSRFVNRKIIPFLPYPIKNIIIV